MVVSTSLWPIGAHSLRELAAHLRHRKDQVGLLGEGARHDLRRVDCAAGQPELHARDGLGGDRNQDGINNA